MPPLRLLLPIVMWGVLSLVVISLSTSRAGAQVIPLPIGSTGVGPLRFDTLPTPSGGWSQRRIEGANGSIRTPAALDASVQTNDVAGLTNALSTHVTAFP